MRGKDSWSRSMMFVLWVSAFKSALESVSPEIFKSIKRHTVVAIFLLASSTLVAQTSAACAEQLQSSAQLYFSNPDSSNVLAIQAQRCAEESNQPLMKAKALAFQGRYNLLKSDLEDAEKRLNEAEVIYREHNDNAGIAYVLKLKSILQGRIGNEEESVALLEKSVEMYRLSDDHEGLIAALLNISLDHTDSEQYDRAESDLAEVYQLIGKDTVENHYYYFQNLGGLRHAQGKFGEAVVLLSAAARVATKYEMEDAIPTINTRLAISFMEMNNFPAADSCLQIAETIAYDGSMLHELAEAYEVRIDYYRKREMYKEALETMTRLTEVNGKILNIEKINSIAALEKKLALSEKEKQLEKQKADTDHARAQTEKLLYVAAGIFLILIITAVMFFRTRKLKNHIASQNYVLEEKNSIIESKNRDITDSITYASHIQQSILPADSQIAQHFTDSFVMFRPRDIVSGDFYWVEQSGDDVILAVGDCTGHGVPGAFMSVIGTNLLNEAVNEHGITEPAAILSRMRKNLIAFLQKNSDGKGVKDGMDISVIVYNKKKLTVQFAGAYNSVYRIRNGELSEFHADKTPVGFYFEEDLIPFTTRGIDIVSGDHIYLFTDGFADQFGGPRGKKFKYRQLKEKLCAASSMSCSEQKSHMERVFDEWKGNLEQIDDVCLIGVKF
ncbi:MAG: hypothetical protein RL007_287 [Bacteroidota bacterium]